MSHASDSSMAPGEYNRSARRTWYIYVALAAGTLFAIEPLLVEPTRHCVEYPCPVWLRATIVALGLVFGGGAAYALIGNLQWGSRIDAAGRTLVWWHGNPPRAEHHIDVDRIGRLSVDTTGDSNMLAFTDTAGRAIHVPTECIPSPIERWARDFTQRFPHVTLETKS